MLDNPPKFSKDDEVTVWFKFSDGHKEVQTIGFVFSHKIVRDKYLYTLVDCPTGFYVAYEEEMTLTTGEDRAALIAQG